MYSIAWPTAWSAPREPALPSVASIFSDSESEDEEDCMYTCDPPPSRLVYARAEFLGGVLGSECQN